MDRHTAPSVRIEPAKGMPAAIRQGELAVVVGAGASGTSAMRLLAALGARVRLLDKNCGSVSPQLRAEAEQLGVEVACGDHTPEQFAGASLVVTSPGIPLGKLAPFIEKAGNPPLIAEIDLALRYVQEPIIAVTGTNGKTTTVTLATAMLEEAGKKVFLGGNIGTPLSEYVVRAARHPEEKADVLVLELSSFQLQGIEFLHPDVAMFLNLSPNHLDHHKDMDEYREAKFRIFTRQTADDLALLPEELVAEYKQRGYKAQLVTFAPSERFAGTQLLGKHNTANAEAAFLACERFGVSGQQAVAAAKKVAPLRHRLEHAGTVAGVTYVNDSKCTTVESLRVALESFDTPTLLLAGGKFKGGDLASLRDVVRKHVKAVGLFGASREIFEEAWQSIVPMTWDATLPEAVRRLRDIAHNGDVILLAPATASFDLYDNYIARGDHFCAIVKELEAGSAE